MTILDIVKTIGTRIQKQRRLKELSIREMAKIVGLSASFISQVEHGKTFPSLSALKKMAIVLDIPACELLKDPIEVDSVAGEDIVQRKKKRRHIKSIANGIEIVCLSADNACDTYKQMQPVLLILQKNASSGNDEISHFGQEFYLVIKGKMEFTVSKKKYTLNKGDSIYFNSKEEHFFKNIYKGITEAYYVATPPIF